MPLLLLISLSETVPSEWITQVGVGGGFVLVVLVILWKAGVFTRESPTPVALTTGATAPSFWEVKLNDIKSEVEKVGAKLDSVEQRLVEKVETNQTDLAAIRSHLHDLRGSLMPLNLAVELLLEALKKERT